jgi:hypothetical protein
VDCVALRGVGISTWVRLDVGTGIGRNAGTCGRTDSSVSFFAETGSEVATGVGGATSAAAGCITLGLAIAASDGIVAGVLTTARSSDELRLDAGGGAVGAAVFSEAGSADSCATGGGAVETFNGPLAGGVAAGLVRTESGSTRGVGAAETLRSSSGLRFDGGASGGAVGAAVFSEAGSADSCATGGRAVETFNGSSAGGVAAGLARTESGGALGVGVAETVRPSPGI